MHRSISCSIFTYRKKRTYKHLKQNNMKNFTEDNRNGFTSLAEYRGQLHISRINKYPVKAAGSANDINPPNRIFYGTEAIAQEDFKITTLVGARSNNFPSIKGKKFTNTYKKGDTVIFAH